jgi:hypothetical protein
LLIDVSAFAENALLVSIPEIAGKEPHCLRHTEIANQIEIGLALTTETLGIDSLTVSSLVTAFAVVGEKKARRTAGAGHGGTATIDGSRALSVAEDGPEATTRAAAAVLSVGHQTRRPILDAVTAAVQLIGGLAGQTLLAPAVERALINCPFADALPRHIGLIPLRARVAVVSSRVAVGTVGRASEDDPREDNKERKNSKRLDSHVNVMSYALGQTQ